MNYTAMTLRAQDRLGRSNSVAPIHNQHRGAKREGDRMANTLYMVIERFRGGDAVPVYRRFRERGRLAPQGLTYVASWVDARLERCFQLMETEDRQLLDDWIARWSDIVDFEVYPVIASAEAAERMAPRLSRDDP
jgi:hypothetical protein